MHKVRVSAKPKYTQNYITVTLTRKPLFHMAGRSLNSVRIVGIGGEHDSTAEAMTVMLPAVTDSVANGAFRGLDALRNVFFGHTPYELGAGVFAGCSQLETAVFAEGTEKVPLATFSDCRKLRMVRLPDSVKRINMDAFKNCSALEKIELPPNLEKIEVSAFWGCSSLEEITLPDSVTELGADAFANCTGLKRVRLPSSLRKIGFCAFQNCTGLKSIEIPEGVEVLPMGVFAGCRNLRHIVLPDSLKYISAYAFYQCQSLDLVECDNPERFVRALEGTPFGRKNWPQPEEPARFPMELLHRFVDEVPGAMLSAMGYPLFDIDKKYQFFLTDYPGIIQVRARRIDAESPMGADNEEFLVDEKLEPVPDIRPTIDPEEFVAII